MGRYHSHNIKSKVQTVLKSTKLLQEHTIYVCMYNCVTCGVKRPDIVKEILRLPCGHWNQRCLENGAKFTHWMSQILNSIFFLWIDLKLKTIHKCFLCPNKRQSSMLCFIAFKM